MLTGMLGLRSQLQASPHAFAIPLPFWAVTPPTVGE
jgi:hypothetical protein